MQGMPRSEIMQNEYYVDPIDWVKSLSFVELNLLFYKSENKFYVDPSQPNLSFNSKEIELRNWMVEQITEVHYQEQFLKGWHESHLSIDEIKSIKNLSPEFKFSLLKHNHISGFEARSLDELTFYYVNTLSFTKDEKLAQLNKEFSGYYESETVKKLDFVTDSFDLLNWSFEWLKKKGNDFHLTISGNPILYKLLDINTVSAKTVLAYVLDYSCDNSIALILQAGEEASSLNASPQVPIVTGIDFSELNNATTFQTHSNEELAKIIPVPRTTMVNLRQKANIYERKLHFISHFKQAYQKRKSRVKQSKETKLYSFTMNKSLEKKLNQICAIEGIKKSEMVERLINEAYFSVSNTKRVFQDTSGVQYRVKPKIEG